MPDLATDPLLLRLNSMILGRGTNYVRIARELGVPHTYINFWLWGEGPFDEQYREPLTAILDSFKDDQQFAPRDGPIWHWTDDMVPRPNTLSDPQPGGVRTPVANWE